MMVGRTLDNLFPKEKYDRGNVAFEVRNINVYDPENVEKRIIKDVSFKAHEGELLGIAGLMGSGRTELAEGIFGIRAKYTTGEILIRGETVQITSPIQAIGKGLVYLSEDRKRYGLVLGMSVKENTTLASLKKVAKFMINENEEIQYTNQYVSYLGVKTPSIETQVNNLSGGNQQKVVLGKWLMTTPQILILDEVTRGIDVRAKFEIYKIMNQLVQSGVVIIMISSELPEILGLCDRILVMHEGRINGEFSAETATQEKIMHCAAIASSKEEYSDAVN
jgi:D-xylose transport system ATP-binding protein